MNRLRFPEILFLSLLIYIFFIIPPLTVPYDEGRVLFSRLSFPFQALISFLVFIVLYIFRKHIFKESYENTSKKKQPFAGVFCFLISFGSLLFISAILQLISGKVSSGGSLEVLSPEGIEWVYLCLSFVFQGFNEEVLYRFYLPESGNYFIRLIDKKRKKTVEAESQTETAQGTEQSASLSVDKKNVPVIFLISETVYALIFAFSHRYLGFFAVLNAFFAHCVLRWSFCKCRNIYVTSLAHIIYNFFSLLCFLYV